jgi:hypothetical protein
MRKSSTLVVVLSICSMVCWAADPGMDVVLVTGEQPGPPCGGCHPAITCCGYSVTYSRCLAS